MLAALLLCALQSKSALTAEDRAEFRALVTAVLAEPDAAKRKALVERGATFEGRAPIAEFVSLLREGPRITSADPTPLERNGAREVFENFGNVLSGLSFVHDGRVLRYCVDIPKSYDAKRPVGLLLDPGHGTGAKADAKGKADFLPFYRRHADAAGLTDWLVARTEIVEQIGFEGLAGPLPDDEVAATFDAFFRDVCSRFTVDCDRIVANGISQTGFWSWYLARANPRRFAGILPMSAVSVSIDPYASNLLNVPIAILHGSADPICSVGQPRVTFALLRRLGAADVRYVEIAGGKHDFEVWKGAPPLLEELAAQPRTRYPRTLSFSVQTLRQPWCGPVRIDDLETQGDGASGTKPTGGVDVTIEGQLVTLRSEGVRALTLALSSDEIDATKPIRVRWNGTDRAEAKTLKPSVAALLMVAGETVDWSSTRDLVVALRAP